MPNTSNPSKKTGFSSTEPIGYLSNTVLEGSTETLDLTNPRVVTPSQSKELETLVVDRKNGVYHLYFHTDDLSSKDWWTTNIGSFTQWVMSLNKNDIIYINQTGKISYFPSILQALVVLDTICFAQKIFIVDHIIETPFVMFICNKIVIEDTGAIIFSNCIKDNATKCELVNLPYIRRLYERAVLQELLTKEEVNSILDKNAIIFKTARELRHATKSDGIS